MRKSLPISVPLSSTYMVPAAEFAVLQSYENGMNYITNRYSQLYLFEDIIKRESMDLGLSLQTDPFDFNPCFHATKIEMQFEYIIKDFIDFIIDSINHGNYVYTYRYIDEYYIKDTASYNQYHVIHMFVIYGYDIERKYSIPWVTTVGIYLAISKSHLMNLQIPYKISRTQDIGI